jgi:hypothetical protein
MISEPPEHIAGASPTTTSRPVLRTDARIASASIGMGARGSITSRKTRRVQTGVLQKVVPCPSTP